MEIDGKTERIWFIYKTTQSGATRVTHHVHGDEVLLSMYLDRQHAFVPDHPEMTRTYGAQRATLSQLEFMRGELVLSYYDKCAVERFGEQIDELMRMQWASAI